MNPKILIDTAQELSYSILPYQKRIAALTTMKRAKEVSLVLDGNTGTVSLETAKINDLLDRLEYESHLQIERLTTQAYKKIMGEASDDSSNRD